MAENNKTTVIVKIIFEAIKNPRHRLSFDAIKEIVGEASDRSINRYVQLLTSVTFEMDPMFMKIKDGDTKYLQMTDSFIKATPSEAEIFFMFEIFQKLGHLIRSKKFETELAHIKEGEKDALGIETLVQYNRKFFYLAPIKEILSNEYINNLDKIMCALLDNRTLEIVYNKEVRTIKPLTLCQYRDALYLIAYSDRFSKERIRSFRIKRIEEIILGDVFHYPSPALWSPEKFFKSSSGIMLEKLESAKIRVFGVSRTIFKDKSFFESKLLEESQSYDLYEMTFSNDDEFIGQLFVYAQDIEIIEPTHLKDEFLKKAHSAIKRNSPPHKKAA